MLSFCSQGGGSGIAKVVVEIVRFVAGSWLASFLDSDCEHITSIDCSTKPGNGKTFIIFGFDFFFFVFQVD